MTVLSIAIAVTALWILSYPWTLFWNYRAVRTSGLPVIVVPLDPHFIPYVIVSVSLRPIFQRLLPTAVYDRLSLTIQGWGVRDKNAIHDRVGSAFILVTAGSNFLWCADPGMAQIILARRKDFPQQPIIKKVMGFLGENILTSDGEAWARQRRLVAPNLNERISEVVWNESIDQANQMVEYMLKQPGQLSNDAINGLRAITINVLGQIAYGQPGAFKPMKLPRDPSADMTYVEAISLCAEFLVFSVFFPSALLRLPIMPKELQTLGAAKQRIPSLKANMLEQERRRIASSANTRDNLMSMLVQLSDQGKKIHDKGETAAGSAGQYLTEDEIGGNLFLFTGAGFDTTANTLAFAITILASHPELQVWIQQELDQVLGGVERGNPVDYSTVFPKLTRCMAMLFETLRLFPPVIHISRATMTPQTIFLKNKTYLVPGSCIVNINTPGLHASRSTWGDDALSFRPSRWLTGDGELVTPPRGTFLPWSSGPRVCPGQKMAQVEFVAIISTLLARCRIEPVLKDGEGIEQARERLVELTQDSQTKLTLQMNKPHEVRLKWVKRKFV